MGTQVARRAARLALRTRRAMQGVGDAGTGDGHQSTVRKRGKGNSSGETPGGRHSSPA